MFFFQFFNWYNKAYIYETCADLAKDFGSTRGISYKYKIIFNYAEDNKRHCQWQMY